MATHVELLTGLVNVVIPEVYQKGMSYYEVLTAVVNKVNELIKQSNEYFSEDVQSVMTKILIGWKNDGTLDALIADAVLDIGGRTYTEQNYVTDGESITESINAIDITLGEATKQLEGLEVNVTTIGVLPDDGIDHTDNLRNFISTGVIPVFPSGRYIISDELLFSHGQSIRCVGKVVFDGTNFIGNNGNAVLKVSPSSEKYTQLSTPTTNLQKGDLTITFNTPHGLKQGDIICLYDNNIGSWSTVKDYYKKSEFCRISNVVSQTVVLLDSPLFDNYTVLTNAQFGVYKMNMGTFSIIGELEVIQGKNGANYGVDFELVKDLNINNLHVNATNGSHVALSLSKCFNATIHATGNQFELSNLGTDYGIVINNSQHVRIKGYFSGARHGATVGGTSGIGCIINRDIEIDGTIKTNGSGNVKAADTHGNCELVTIKGNIYGGVSLGGARNKLEGVIHGDKDGVCVLFRDIKSFEHDLSNTLFITDKNPGIVSRGVIDWGGSGILSNNVIIGGLLNLSNVVINAPNAERGIMLRTRGDGIVWVGDKEVHLNNTIINILNNLNSIPCYIRDDSALKNFTIIADNLKYSTDRPPVLLDYDVAYLDRKKGEETFTTDVGVNYIDVQITFNKPYPANYAPIIETNLTVVTIGNLAKTYYNINNEGFVVRIFTTDGSNFSNSLSSKIRWLAK